jgi:hypothetical protein
MGAARDRLSGSDRSAGGDTQGLHGRLCGSTATVSEQLDEAQQFTVDMPLLLLITARQLINTDCAAMPGTAVMPRPNTRPGQEGTDIMMMLMMRLWLLNKVGEQLTVRLSELLGFIDVGAKEVILRVPSSGFTVEHVDKPPTRAQFAEQADSVDTTWAYSEPGESGVDSWMFLRSEPAGKVVSIQL